MGQSHAFTLSKAARARYAANRRVAVTLQPRGVTEIDSVIAAGATEFAHVRAGAGLGLY